MNINWEELSQLREFTLPLWATIVLVVLALRGIFK